jgi:membrane carboxypeptidase/penicillin-binding protein
VGVDPDTGRLYASVVGEALYASDDFGRTWKSLGLEGSAVNRFIFLPHAGK